ncbi:hypothetical protein TNCV_2007441 [Trichonephila clavipes]|nr:hypothetical protein TNCV_2007441 [Trichonephila clavipes]
MFKPPVGRVWKLGEVVLAQMSSLSLDHCSKLRIPPPKVHEGILSRDRFNTSNTSRRIFSDIRIRNRHSTCWPHVRDHDHLAKSWQGPSHIEWWKITGKNGSGATEIKSSSPSRMMLWLSGESNINERYLTVLGNSLLQNYAPLRSAIHVLETLQEVFFWDGVQKPRPISLDVRNIDNIFFHP